MKNLLICVLVIATIICVGCGGNAAPIQNSADKTSDEKISESKIIAVYFSHTKHTEVFAKKNSADN